MAAGAAMLAALAGCRTAEPPRDYEPVVARFYLEVPPQVAQGELITLPSSHVQIPVNPRIVFSEADVGNVELVHVDLGLCLMFEFTPDAARSLLRVTAANLGRRLVMTLNGRAFGTRLIDAPISDGRLFVFAELRDEELTATAVNLKKTAHEVQTALARKQSK